MTDKNTLIRMQRDIMRSVVRDVHSAVHVASRKTTCRGARAGIAEIEALVKNAVDAFDILGREINNIDAEERRIRLEAEEAAETPQDAV